MNSKVGFLAVPGLVLAGLLLWWWQLPAMEDIAQAAAPESESAPTASVPAATAEVVAEAHAKVALAQSPPVKAQAKTGQIPETEGMLSVLKFGVIGDGRTDDTEALQRAVRAAAGKQLRIPQGLEVLISSGITIEKPLKLTGAGYLKLADNSEANIGVTGRDGVLRVESGAAGTVIEGLTIDLNHQGRNAVNVAGAGSTVQNVTVRNYWKRLKADGENHGTSESGVRVLVGRVLLNGVSCHNMVSEAADSVPRCVSVQGDAADVVVRDISGTNINGGVVVGAARNLHIDGFDFRGLTDNGLYILPRAQALIAERGYLADTEEPIVIENTGSVIRNVQIVNPKLPIGLQNAHKLRLENIRARYDAGHSVAPAFLRTRKKNQQSSEILLTGVNAVLLHGDAVLSLTEGRVDGFRVEESYFETHWTRQSGGPGGKRKILVRHVQGDAVSYNGVTFKVVDKTKTLNAQSFKFQVGSGGQVPDRTSLKAVNEFLFPGSGADISVERFPN